MGCEDFNRVKQVYMLGRNMLGEVLSGIIKMNSS